MKMKCFTCVWFFLIISVLMIGCSTVKDSVGYYESCINDPQCVSDVQNVGAVTAQSVHYAVDKQSEPSEIAVVLGALASNVVMYLYGAYRGKMKQKAKGV